MGKKININLKPHTLYKKLFKMDIRFKCKTIKLLEENIREYLQDLGPGRVLSHDTKTMIHKEKINKLDFIKIKTFVPQKTSTPLPENRSRGNPS